MNHSVFVRSVRIVSRQYNRGSKYATNLPALADGSDNSGLSRRREGREGIKITVCKPHGLRQQKCLGHDVTPAPAISSSRGPLPTVFPTKRIITAVGGRWPGFIRTRKNILASVETANFICNGFAVALDSLFARWIIAAV